MNNTDKTNALRRRAEGTKLYSVQFPLWMLVFVPSTWAYMLPISFVINSVVLLVTLTLLARRRGDTGYRPWGDWLRTVFLTWIANVISHIIAGGFLLFWGMGPSLLLGETNTFGGWWGANVAEPMTENPFESIFAVAFALLAIGLAGLLVYFFNKNMSLRLTKSLDVPEIKRTALVLAVTTAPWFMLLPSKWFW